MATETFPDVSRHLDDARESLDAATRTMPKKLSIAMVDDELANLRAIALAVSSTVELIANVLRDELERNDILSRAEVSTVMNHLSDAIELTAEVDHELGKAQGGYVFALRGGKKNSRV